ncbi:MAG: hypothetical protein DYG97_10225 [Ignavibacteria bacterium CHB3]|nr:hypothetical protein [Ignavibacteria bacterium CHB3]
MNNVEFIIYNYWLNGLFVLLACIMNAGMDSLRHNFYSSFAKNWNEKFWNPEISWLNKYYYNDATKERKKIWFIVIPAAFTDGWHLLKMFMLGFLFIAMSLNVTNSLLTDFYLFLFYQLIWNVLFNPIYYKLRKW